MKIQFIWPNFDCPLGLSIGVAQLSGALILEPLAHVDDACVVAGLLHEGPS
jgi:hypothetical protein